MSPFKRVQHFFSRLREHLRAGRTILGGLVRRYRTRDAETKIVTVNEDDLDLYTIPMLVSLSLLGGTFGFFGFLVVWLSVGLAVSSFFANQYSLAVLIIPGTIIFGLIGGLRNRIVKRNAKRGFASLVRFRRRLEVLFWIAVVLAIDGMLARTRIIPEISISLSVFLMGVYFLLATPRFFFGSILLSLREARLSMKMFLLVWNSGSPDDGSTGHRWLRRAMAGVAERLKMSGLRTPSEDLFAGSSYSVFKGTISDSELDDLGEYIVRPSDWFKVNWTIPYLLSQSKEAEKAGFTKPRSMRRLVFGESTLQRAIQFLIVVILGIIEVLLKFFGFIPSNV